MKKRSIYLELFIAYVVFLVLAILVPGSEITELIKVILSAASFLFAIMLAFSIANRHKRLNEIRHILRNDDALLLSIYNLASAFGEKELGKIRSLLDSYLVKQIDYELEDYDKSTPEFLRLYNHIVLMSPKSEKQASAKSQMLGDIRDSTKNQKEVLYWVKDRMMVFEWMALLILCGTMLFCLFYMNDNTLVSIVTIPLLSTALILLLLVLRDLNNLQWQERNWIWKPLEELFLELDLLPYYPEPLFKHGRIDRKDLKYLKEYRVASYPHPYPDITGKTVHVVKN